MTVVLERGPRTEEELWYLTQALWGHKIPRTQVCTDHSAPFEAFAVGYFAREPQTLIHGSRGLSGKSRLLSILGMTKAAVLGADVNIVGGSLNQSENIHQTMRDAWEHKNAPKYLIKDEGATRITLKNGAVIRPLTASQKTVRGPHPPFLLLDEIDEMDQAILDAALGQPMPQTNWRGDNIKPQTTMSSTWQYPDKTFAEVYRRHQTEDLPIYQWCYRETSNPVDGWLDPDFIEEKKRQIPAEMWRVEYELGEPSIGNRAFDSEAVERMFSLDPEEHVKKKLTKDFLEYQFEVPRQDREYVISADWAKSQDWTVITVCDVTHFPVKVVYWVRMRRRPYPVMIGAYNDLMKKYNAEGIHDATGLGGVVADYIDNRAVNFMMTGVQRDNMLSDYIAAVENDRFVVPRVDIFYKNHLYCSVEEIYSRAKEFHLPDEVCSMALAWNIVSRRAVPSIPIMLPNTNDPNWMDLEVRENKSADKKTPWNVSVVRDKTQEAIDELDFMV
jgi:hypothetical protein